MSKHTEITYHLKDEDASIVFAQAFARAVSSYWQTDLVNPKSQIIYLLGDLGAGKSFFSRAFIQYFLPDQKVKSPTYTLVESYSVLNKMIHHFDLYRLCDPEELEYLAIRDLLCENSLALVEWPQKGEGILPAADLVIEMIHLEQGRDVRVTAHNAVGEAILGAIGLEL